MPIDKQLLFRLARSRVARRLERGDELDEVQHELSTLRGLDEGDRDALWLYAWALAERSGPRRERAELAELRARARRRWRSPVPAVGRVALLGAAALVPPWSL